MSTAFYAADRYREAFIKGKSVFIVMEHAPRGDLFKIIERYHGILCWSWGALASKVSRCHNQRHGYTVAVCVGEEPPEYHGQIRMFPLIVDGAVNQVSTQSATPAGGSDCPMGC